MKEIAYVILECVFFFVIDEFSHIEENIVEKRKQRFVFDEGEENKNYFVIRSELDEI